MMGDVIIQTDAGTLNAYLREPLGANAVPGVVVIHEALGLTDDIRRYCQRFADEGYLALAPDLFSRSLKWRCLIQTFRALSRGAGQAFRDVELARGYLAEHPRCTGHVGVIGFCMGGGFALLMAPTGLFEAAAVKYGRVPEDAEKILQGACPIVGSYGGRDFTESGHAERLEHALTSLGVPHDVKVYPEASHSFMNEYQGVMRLLGRVTGFGYHAPSTEDAWQRVLATFRKYLHPA
jgi:carboxymethylenebutenolidase